MSLYKIDGHILSVNELITWIAGFITLFEKGKLKNKRIPPALLKILSENSDAKETSNKVLIYLKENEDYLPVLIKIVQFGFTELAIEKHI
ncbi:MAG: hypothetical protein WC552_08040 [Candidatus Omnitrophota bacterium]